MEKNIKNFYTPIFEDKSMIVVSKNHGVHVIPDRYGNVETTLQDALTQNYGKLLTVHRLDAGTGGVIVYAKNPYFHREMCGLFEGRLVKKTYIALSKGEVAPQTLMLPIAQGGKGKYKVNFKSGKQAITSFIQRSTCNGNSLITAYPFTGRTHQIRVHLKVLKAPLYFDHLYGEMGDGRLSLFAKEITFLHPFEKTWVTFSAPYSDFMMQTAQNLELSLKDVY